MSQIAPGWYPDPADRTVQRYWDGDGWIGEPLPVDAQPAGPPHLAPASPESPTPPHPARLTQSALTPPPAALSPPPALSPPRSGPPLSGPPLSGPSLGNASHAGVTTQPIDAPGLPYARPHPGAHPGPHPGPLPVPRPQGYHLAAVPARLAARVVDTLAVLGLNLLVNWWLGYQFWLEIRPYVSEIYRRAEAGQSTPPAATISGRANWLIIAMLVVAVALWFAYEVPAMANNGQTPGKRLMGIKVIRLESAEPLGFRRAWRRWNGLGLPTLLWSFCCVGFILQFVDCLFVAIDRPLHQALHDRAAATVVVVADGGSNGGQQ